MDAPRVRVRTWVRACDDDILGGLLGWLSVEYGVLLIDNITLRKTADGRFALAFPRRTAKNGQVHSVVRPVDDDARRAIEREILGQLGQREGIRVGREEPR